MRRSTPRCNRWSERSTWRGCSKPICAPAAAVRRHPMRRAGCGIRSGASERVDAEIVLRVGPHQDRRPPGAARQRAERFHRILVAVLGVNSFAGTEVDALAADPHLLALQACQMHLDARALAVEEGVMLEAGEVEFAAKLAIDARQQIEIELGGDALAVVIGLLQHA